MLGKSKQEKGDDGGVRWLNVSVTLMDINLEVRIGVMERKPVIASHDAKGWIYD